MKEKVLVICQHFWPENFRINDICEGLIERGYKVDVLCGIPNYPEGYFYEGYGWFKNRKEKYKDINIRRVFEIPRKTNTNLRIFLNYISFPLASIFHIPYLLTQKYDKIFLYQLSPVMMSISGIFLGKIKKTEIIMYVLDIWPENLFSVLEIKNKFLRKIAYAISRWHYKNVDKLIAISNKMREKLIAISKLPEEKVTFIPQACEKIYETEIKDQNLISKHKNTFNFVFTGNISPAQSFETVLFAAKKMYNEDKIRDVKWIIVGSGMSKKWLENEVKLAKISQAFSFEGQVDMKDIPKYTYIADALFGCLVKSDMLDLTIPAKCFSYIAAGKPVALAMDGEIQDIIKEADCGYIVDAEDNIEFYNIAKKLYTLSSKELIQKGTNAKKYHYKHFERNKNIDKLSDFIEKKT